MKGTKQVSISKKLKSCAMGVGIDMLLVLAGSFVIAVCIHNEYLNINSCNPAALILRFISAFLASMVVCKGKETEDISAWILLLVGILLLDLCVSAAFFSTDLSMLGWGSLAVIGGEITAAVVCRTTKKRSSRWKRRRPTR